MLSKAIILDANDKPLLKRSSSHSHSSQFCSDSACCLVCQCNDNSSAFTSMATSNQCAKWQYLPMSLCDRNSVILWTNRARYALNKEIQWGKHLWSMQCWSLSQVFEKVSRPLKCHSIQWNLKMRTLLGPTGNVLIREVSWIQGDINTL